MASALFLACALLSPRGIESSLFFPAKDRIISFHIYPRFTYHRNGKTPLC
jgi:hypothetical protein